MRKEKKTGGKARGDVVSILMPIYKPNLEWLKASIKSLQDQVHEEWILILSLDGRDQQTISGARLAEEMLNRMNRLVIIEGERSGIVQTLNRGLRACNTEYTARLDADDKCKTRRLEHQLKYMNENPGAACCGMQVTKLTASDEEIKSFKYPTKPNSCLALGAFINTPIAHPTLMFRSELVKEIGGYREKRCMEDYELLSRLATKGSLINLEETGIAYRVHENQHSKTIRPTAFDLLETRMRFLKLLIASQPAFVIFAWLPLILYVIGPIRELEIRTYAISTCAKFKNAMGILMRQR